MVNGSNVYITLDTKFISMTFAYDYDHIKLLVNAKMMIENCQICSLPSNQVKIREEQIIFPAGKRNKGNRYFKEQITEFV